MVKKSSGDFWSNVVEDDKNGVHDILGEEEERINEVHEGLSHLTSDGETLVLLIFKQNLTFYTG